MQIQSSKEKLVNYVFLRPLGALQSSDSKQAWLARTLNLHKYVSTYVHVAQNTNMTKLMHIHKSIHA